MSKKKQTEFDFQKYYKFSVFVNRYALVLWSFVISVLIMFVASAKEYKVIAYNNQTIVKDIVQLQDSIRIWEDINSFNSKSSYIKSDLMLTNSNTKDWKINLWIWIFRDKFDIPYPMNIELSSQINFKNKQEALENYISTLKNSNKLNNSIKKPKINPMEDEQVLESYNLSCINTYLHWTIFCDANKNSLLSDLITNPKIDIKPSFYKTLFDSLSLSDLQKCNLLKTIYNKKYNLENIKDVVKANKSCSLDDFESTDDFLKYVALGDHEDLFRINKNISNNYSVLSSKLIQQLYILLKQEEIPDYMMTNSYNFVRDLIRSWNIDSTLAYIIKSTYNDIKNRNNFRKKTTFSSLSAWMESVLNWDKVAQIDWINSMINDKKMLASLETQNKNLLHWTSRNLISEREKLINIFKNKYEKTFTVTKKINYDDKQKTADIEWYLHLNFNVWWKKDTAKVKISFNVKNIIWTNFDIYNLKFVDSKIENYMSKLAKPDTDSLLSLKEDLQWKLYWPLINDNFWQNESLDPCKKYIATKWEFSCSNSKLSINIEWKYNWALFVYANIDKDLNIKSLSLSNNSLTFKNDKIIDEQITLNLSTISRYLSLLNKKKNLTVKDATFIKKIVENRIKQYIWNENLKLSWLSKQETVVLNSKFKKYLDTELLLIRKLWNYYKLYFNLEWTMYFAVYDKTTNNIVWMSIYEKDRKKTFLFKNINIKFSDIDIEKLNDFKSKPLNYLKIRDSSTYDEYNKFMKLNK